MYKVLLASIAAIVATPASARDGDFYVGLDIGAAISPDSDATFVPAVGAGTSGEVSFGAGLGYEGAAVVGYDLGLIRLEAEASYKSAGVDSITSDFAVGTVIASGTNPGTGDISALTIMGNALLDFGNEEGLSFFVGGGLGWTQVSYNSIRLASSTAIILDDKESGLAWQALAGLRYRIGENLELTGRYRFFNVPETELVGFGGRAVGAKLQSHSLLAGVTFNFGSP